MTYRIGQTVRSTATFTDAAGAVADPTTVTFRTYSPRTQITTSYTYALAQITRSSTGVYYIDITFDGYGPLNYKWSSTGTPAQAYVGQWSVQTDVFDGGS